ncbi:serine hydrolase [Sinanaerobacter sp. ZZT-01]|uniref:serine hydrolase n=1 Tax=Sinanaerobacter sp. ZZT-01 TaxID=3111540 RepID=UPI002D77428D|nr:serine hydrolase [Sinanaerobacter sp. ZZT-01]WRR92522.1 serine hydrolase [Sinanaerobacter sp. ZZT-01]
MKNRTTVNELLIQREMDFWNVPGLSLSIVKKGHEPYTKSFGWRDKENKLEVMDTTLFGVASCSKSMTSAIIAMLVASGKLDYDIPVINYIPGFAMMDEEATGSMTLRDMLCHRTGLGGHDAIWPVPKTLKEFSQVFPYLLPSAPFRSRPQYSNIIYAVIGYIAETVTGQSWTNLMQNYLFDPLGMTSANCQAKAMIDSDNFAHPYQVLDGKLTKLPVWNVDVVAPAASVNCTAIDMCKWLSFLINKGRTADGTQLIPENIFQAMITPQVDFSDDIGPDAKLYPSDGYAMGWKTGKYREKLICKHTGKIEGYTSIQAFMPDDDIGISLMMNLHSPTVAIMHTILYTLIDSLLNLPSVDWTWKFRDDRKPTAEDYKDCHVDIFHSIYPDAIPNEMPSQQLMASYKAHLYEGTYHNPGYGFLTIVSKGDKLYMKYRDMFLPATPYWTGNFRVDNVKEDIFTLSIPLTFICDEKHKSIGLRVRFEPLIDDIVFLKKD